MTKAKLQNLTAFFFVVNIISGLWYYRPMVDNYFSVGFVVALSSILLSLSLKAIRNNSTQRPLIDLVIIPFLLMPCLLIINSASSVIGHPDAFSALKALVAVIWFFMTIKVWRKAWRG